MNLKSKTKRLVLPKQEGLEYYVDIIGKTIFKLTQDNATNIQILEKADIDDFVFKTIFKFKNQVQKWHLFENFLAFQIQDSYKTNLLVLDHLGHKIYAKQLNSDTSSAWLSKNDYAFTDIIKAKIQSTTKPPKWVFINPVKKEVKEKASKFIENYNYLYYHQELVFLEDLPVTIAFNKKKIKPDSPVYLMSYGAYFENIKRYFMPEIVSLLDLGFIYAIAHIRGGNFLGNSWALAGMGKNRQNSIDDLLKAAKFLKSYHNGNHKVISHGQSAGATILAAAINQDPKAFDAAILQVPFLDVLNSLNNIKFFKSIEFAQWGNPNSQAETIKKYDPIRNIKKQKYPNLLVMASVNDIRVGYKEAIKYIHLIRENSKDSLALLYLNQHGGHQSDYESEKKENTLRYTFLINEGLK